MVKGPGTVNLMGLMLGLSREKLVRTLSPLTRVVRCSEECSEGIEVMSLRRIHGHSVADAADGDEHRCRIS